MRSFDRDNFYACPSPPLRVNDELRHNPYVGSFHPVSRLSEEAKYKSLGIHNPHLGTFRHSPAAAAANHFPDKLKANLGFKGLLLDDSQEVGGTTNGGAGTGGVGIGTRGPGCAARGWNKSVFSQVQLVCGRPKLPLHNLSTQFLATMPTYRFCQPLPISSTGLLGQSLDTAGAATGSENSSVADDGNSSARERVDSLDSWGSSDSAPTCAICLEAFTDGCELRDLACHHCFHKQCVDMWLSGQHSEQSVRTATCPTCRQDAVTYAHLESVTRNQRVKQRTHPRVSVNTEFSEYQQVNGSDFMSMQASPILLPNVDADTDAEATLGVEYLSGVEGAVEVDINGVMNNLLSSNGLAVDSFVGSTDLLMSPPRVNTRTNAIDSSDSEPEGDTSPFGSPSGLSSSSGSDIPDRAFVNMGRFLYSSFALSTTTTTATATNRITGTRQLTSEVITELPVPVHTQQPQPTMFNSQELQELYAAIPDIQSQDDECMLGSTYDMCGVPFTLRKSPDSQL